MARVRIATIEWWCISPNFFLVMDSFYCMKSYQIIQNVFHLIRSYHQDDFIDPYGVENDVFFTAYFLLVRKNPNGNW